MEEASNEKRLYTITQVMGTVAMWAVRQSPYDCPDGIAAAMTALRACLEPKFTDGMEALPMAWLTRHELGRMLKDAFETIPQIEVWNHRKNGREGHGFCSRYSQPSPDDDFIDLDAMAGNVVRSCLQEQAAEDASCRPL